MIEETDLSKLNVVALAGGVGGAKLAVGLQEVLEPGRLTVVVNTADDFEHWGLQICPDVDTVMYNLAGVHNPELGWGRADETFRTLDTMGQIGGEDWFLLGDQDLPVHLRRTEWARQGISLTEVTERLRRSFGIQSAILPMSDHPVSTLIHTEDGDLPFQHYFVRHRCEPVVMDLTFMGAEKARPSDFVLDALDAADVIVIAPSNPYLSIDPILSVAGMRSMLLRSRIPKIAVSPIVGGEAIKGPAAKIMTELGKVVSAATVVEHYRDLLDGFVLDATDEALHNTFEVPTLVTDTIMRSLDVKADLARAILAFAAQLSMPEQAPQLSV